MIRALNLLRSGLDLAFGRDPRSFADWALPQAMTKTLAEVRRQHDRPEAKPVAASTISAALAAFRKTGALPRFTDLKYVCLGVAWVERDGRCLLAEEALRTVLLDLAESVSEPRRQMKCFQGLLRSYWSFPVHGSQVPEAAVLGLGVLRIWLCKRFIALDGARMAKPDWFVMLSSHADLLTDTPCDRYAQALLKGNGALLQLAVNDLAIPSDSWVMEETVLAAMRAAALLDDDDFRAALPRLLAISFGQAGVAVSAPLSMRCIAKLLSRYARSASVPAYRQLFDAALGKIGNPWRRRASWEIHVQDDHGRPDDLAREMVSAWLKHRLITDFFEIFGGAAGCDRRRTDYWLRFEPFIEDMWFALAMNADGRRAARHEDFLRRGEGLLLDSDEPENPVLIMRIGEFVAVEYGAQDNDLMLFRWDSLAPALARMPTPDKRWFSMPALRTAKSVVSLEHRDSPEQGYPWERAFDEYIRPVIRRGL